MPIEGVRRLDQRERRLLILLFGAALLLRASGLVWGAPNADEALLVSAPARVLTGQLVPEVGFYPPFLYYVLATLYAVLYGVGRLLGLWASTSDFRAEYFENPTLFLFTTRLAAASMAAASAPLAALIAHRLRLRWRSCLIVGGLVAISPAHVLLSHTSKHDIWLSSMVLVVVLAVLVKMEQPTSRKADVLLGMSVALAFSLKQSALFLVLALGAGFVIWMRAEVGWRRTLQSAGIALLSSLALWLPLNAGIILDADRFFDYQTVLRQIYATPDGSRLYAVDFLPQLIDRYRGATLPAFLLWLLVPFIRRDKQTLLIWGAILGAIVINAVVSGGEATVFHLLPYTNLIIVMAGIGAVSLLERVGGRLPARALPLALVAIFLGIGTVEVIRQSLVSPMNGEVAVAVAELTEPGESRILASSLWLVGSLPIDSQADQDSRLRHERLAQKYGIELVDEAVERSSEDLDEEEGYYVRQFPWALGGLEGYEEDEVEIVAAYSWPLQLEEWDLSYWTSQGFGVFVVDNEDAFIEGDVDGYRQFHQQIHDECNLIETIVPRKPLFGEEQARIYTCADRASR